MSKFPRLEMMRAQRLRREAEATAPYRAELDAAGRTISGLRATIRKIEATMGTEIGKHILDYVGEQISSKLMQIVHEAVSKAHRASAAAVQITLPADIFRFSDPRSIQSDILLRYAQESAPRLSLRIDDDPMQMVSIVDIRVPELACRQALPSR